MATVIERLVIQGCNPRAPFQSTRCSSQPHHQAKKAPAATPIAVTPLVPKQSRPFSALTISGRSTGPTSVAPTAPSSAGAVRTVSKANSSMQPAALPVGSASPIVRKMEYLALVRQARHGMSSGDTAPRSTTGASHADGDPFIIEGRPVASRMSTASCQSSVSSRQGAKNAGSIETPDAFMYSDSDISSIGEHPEGHVDQFQLLQMTQRPRGGRAGSIRSVRSDSSNRSLQLPTLTRGSSEPGVSGNTSSLKHKQGRWTLDSECDELTAVANHLLLVRQQFKLATSAPERNRTTKPATPRSAYSGCRAEELKSCLNVSSQPILESGAATTERVGHQWTSSKHKLVENQSGRQSEGALLYKRHKLTEKVAKGAPAARKYTFSSVSSYLNFNKLNAPSSTSPSMFAVASQPQSAGPGAPKSASGSSSKPAISATSLKRSQTYKHDSTVINDLDDYFTVKTPRFDPKSRLSTGSGHSGVQAPAPTPRMPVTAATGDRQAPGANQIYAQEAPGTVADATAVSVSPVTDVTGPGLARAKRAPIVSVPSAGTEHCSEKMTS